MRTTRAALLVAAAGLAVSLIWALTSLLDQVQRPAQFSRTALPGQVQVLLTQPGPHVVYHEVVTGSDATTPLPASEVDVRGPDGALVPVEPYLGELQYDHDGALGSAVGVFSATLTGPYLVAVADGPGTGGAIAVGDDLAPGVVRAIALPAVTAIAALALAALLVLMPSLARQREPLTSRPDSSRGLP